MTSGTPSLLRGTYIRMVDQNTALVEVGQRYAADSYVRAKVLVPLPIEANTTCFLANEYANNAPWLVVGALQYVAIPTVVFAGTILQRHGAAPSGFIAADGSIVSRTDFADIFASMGDRYGAGDGSTTFQLPTLPNHIIKV